MAVARFAAARRLHLLPCLLCLLLVATAALDFPELDGEMAPALFQIEPEDGQEVWQEEAEADSEPDLVEGGESEQALEESMAVQEMREHEQEMEPKAGWQVEEQGSTRRAGGLKAAQQSPVRTDRDRLRRLPLRRRMAEAGCDANPALCLDPSYYPAGPTCCGARCVNTNYDNRNCGYCGNACAFGTTCCIGLCIDTQSDSSNCGKCANECPPGDTCAFGFCGYGYS